MDYNTDQVKEWTSDLEDFLKALGEKSLCLSILHKYSEQHFSYKSTMIDLPVIVLSTLCGSLTLSAKNMFGEEMENDALKIVGGLSLFTSILATIQSYFAYNRCAENHRISQISYSQLYRFLKVQLGLPRKQRMAPSNLLKVTMSSFERLTETSNLIPVSISVKFKKEYKKEKTVSRPSEVNGLESIKVHMEEKQDDLVEIKTDDYVVEELV